MGLYNIIRRKKSGGEKPEKAEGEQVVAKTEKDFASFCESLNKEFTGIMRLKSNTPGKPYAAALLLEKGNVIGSSFEENARKTVYKEDAISQIKKMLSGTRGGLEVYSFTSKDMEITKKNNKETLLDSAIPFSSLDMKIRSNLESLPSSNKKNGYDLLSMMKESDVKALKVEEGFSLVDFARKLSPNQAGTKEDFSNALGDEAKQIAKEVVQSPRKVLGISDAKTERFAELKKKRQMEDMALMKRISQITSKKPPESVSEAGKVETSIDRLYKLVEKYKRLRIDNELSEKLGVSRAQIESWAMILEEHNLVELHYPAIGEPEIRKIGEGHDSR